jgi:hypothetical protein
MQRLNQFPLVRWARVHPRLAAWIVLSVGMIVILLIEAANVGLLPGQVLALMAACVLVAGACVWIIAWEDADDAEPPADPLKTPVTEPNPPLAEPVRAHDSEPA